jgi:hypothetical protein
MKIRKSLWGQGFGLAAGAYSWSEGTRIEEEIFTVVARDGVENSAVEIRTLYPELSRRVSIPDSR